MHTMKYPEIRLGIIGMGPTNMASTLVLACEAPDLRYRITGVCGGNAERIAETARKFDIAFCTDDYRELVSRNDVDVVSVFSPDHLHADHCIAALEHEKHVVCTKPMVTTIDDARRLVTLVRSKKRKFLVGQTMRFDRQFVAAKRMLDDGDLGNIIALESHYVHDMRPVYSATPWRLNTPQDFMFGGCVHSIDVIRAFGGDVESVHAVASRGGMTPSLPFEDNFFINLRFTSGIIGRVSGLYGIVHPPMPMMQFGIYGDKGSLQSEYTDNEPGQLRVVLDKLEDHKAMLMDYEPERDLSAYGHGATVTRYMRHFQECLDEDREPTPGVVDGAKSVAVGVAAWNSIRSGQQAEVEPIE